MRIIHKSYEYMKMRVWVHNRQAIMRQSIQQLRNKNVSIISMNCTGGILFHDLGLRFMSPTINLHMQAEDFIKFCENLPYYLSLEHLQRCCDHAVIGDRTYPIAYLGDIVLFLVHYPSIEEAERKWNERKRRIQWDNIAIIATDRDGMTDDLKERFERLPYPKVMFVHLPDEKHPSCFYLNGYENEDSVGIITNPKGWSGKRAVDQFDYISFFNSADFRGNGDS